MATFRTRPLPQAPSSFTKKNYDFDFQQPASPLDTLVRRTSSRRRNGNGNGSQNQDHQDQLAAPPSPLIHSRFRDTRANSEGEEDEDSFMDMNDVEEYDDPRDVFARNGDTALRDSLDRSSDVYTAQFRYDDVDSDSNYSRSAPLRDSWQTQGPRQPERSSLTSRYTATTIPDEIPSIPSSPTSPLPSVVVTSPDYPGDSSNSSAARTFRQPIMRTVGAVSNYSRPVRPINSTDSISDANHGGGSGSGDGQYSNASNYYVQDGPGVGGIGTVKTRTRHNSSSVPILEEDILDPDAKRRVLERNRSNFGYSPAGSARSTSPYQHSSNTSRGASPSPSPSLSPSPSPSPIPFRANSPSSSLMTTATPSPSMLNTPNTALSTRLPTRPPPHPPNTPRSLYYKAG
jgi:hypothetical protein